MEALNFLSISETENTSDLCMKIYPNPSNGVIFVDFGVKGDKNVQVFDVLGKLIYNVDIQDDNSIIQNFLTNLSSGVYLVKMTSESKNETLKVVKN